MGLKPGLLKSTFNAENFIGKLIWFISSDFGRSFVLKCVSQPEKLIKPLLVIGCGANRKRISN